jgi:hypothetical protein
MTTPTIDMADLENKIKEPAKPADDGGIPEFLRRLEFHPLANEFPLMEGVEFDALVDDIRARGLLELITVFEGKILEGRNRYRAGLQAGFKFVFTDHFMQLPKGLDPLHFVISKNIRRRHLTSEQRREIIAKLLKQSPEASDRQIAVTTGVDHKTVGAVRAEQEATGEIPQLEKRTGRDGRKRPRSKKTGTTGKTDFKQLEAFKATWEGFNSWQKRAFVKTFKDELGELIQEVEAEEAAKKPEEEVKEAA